MHRYYVLTHSDSIYLPFTFPVSTIQLKESCQTDIGSLHSRESIVPRTICGYDVRVNKSDDATFYKVVHQWDLLYCIVCIHLYSASCSAHQSEAFPCSARDPKRREHYRERYRADAAQLNPNIYTCNRKLPRISSSIRMRR